MNELLAAILAAPEDDTPRLVYADHLTERGEASGELIVVQCERERLEREDATRTSAYRQLCWRERELLAQLPGDYRRGFLRRVGFAGVPVVEELRLLAREPLAPLLETIVFRDGANAIELDAKVVLEALPALSTLPPGESLWLPEHGLPHETLLGAVTGVRYSLPTERTIRDLIESETPKLRGVTVLNGLRHTLQAFGAYASSPAFARLEHLELWRMSDSDATHISRHAPLRTRHLTIMREDDHEVVDLTSPALPSVRELRLSGIYDPRDIARLNADANSLERWHAPHGIVGVEAFRALASGPLPERLRHLEVGHCHANELVALANAPWKRLTSLAIGNGEIGFELAMAPALGGLVDLRLFGCKIAPEVEAAVRARFPRVRIE